MTAADLVAAVQRHLDDTRVDLPEEVKARINWLEIRILRAQASVEEVEEHRRLLEMWRLDAENAVDGALAAIRGPR